MSGETPLQESQAPVLFLDIDGVLNRTRSATHIRIDEDLVERLRDLVNATGSQIVLSTFWRPFLPYVQYVLHRHGISAKTVIGRTPGRSDASDFAQVCNDQGLLNASAFDDAEYASRASEIHSWLDAHPRVVRYVILDDRSSAADACLAPRFVQTDAACGLTEADAARCKELLTS